MSGRRFVALGAAALLAAMLPGAAGRHSRTGRVAPRRVAPSPNGLYVVEMPVRRSSRTRAACKGLKATAPKKGQKIDPNSSEVVAYAGYLNAKHGRRSARSAAARSTTTSTRTTASPPQLSVDQANKLVGTGGVVSVSPDEIQTVDTSSTPAFLGLSDPRRPLEPARRRGQRRRRHHHRDHRHRHLAREPELHGPDRGQRQCQQGREAGLPADPRLARQVHPGRGVQRVDVQPEAHRRPVVQRRIRRRRRHRRDLPVGVQLAARLRRPRHAHRVHRGRQQRRARPPAPRPSSGRSAAWRRTPASPCTRRCGRVAPGQGSGYNTDLVAAIDQAVADGVDVINYSISGTQTNFRDPVEISFLYAAAAGIFVAQSAGNSGPATSTVAHPVPGRPRWRPARTTATARVP